MKRYIITYLNGDRSKPIHLIQISKSGKRDGVIICFWNDGKKHWQDNWKNDLMNGIDKEWRSNSTNWYYTNWKKGNEQGIQIIFER